MTREDAIAYIDSNTVATRTAYDNIEDLGQINREKIIRMVQVGHTLGLSFTFSEIYNGPDDDWEHRTIRASGTNLFVWPCFSTSIDLSLFWRMVEK